MYVRSSQSFRAREESHLCQRSSLCRGVTTQGCPGTTCVFVDSAGLNLGREVRACAASADCASRNRRQRPPGTLAGRAYAVSVRSAGAADRKPIDPEGRLSYTDGNALAVLAAGADSIIELQIVPDHRDPREHIRTIADQRRALQRRADAALVDGVRLAR